jgi:spore coat protein H
MNSGNRMKIFKYLLLSCVIIPAMVIGCSASANGKTARQSNASQLASYSHSEETEPDYTVVLPDDQVNEITITISPDNWASLLDDMTSRYGEFGSSDRMGGGNPAGNRPGGQAGDNQPPAENADGVQRERPDMENPPSDKPEMATPPADIPAPEAQENNDHAFSGEADTEQPQMDNAARPGGDNAPMPAGGGMGGRGGMLDGEDDENPIWVDASITFNDETWEHVGFRLKGNSSLRSSWNSGNFKLPFKLDFDQYEDDYLETENQRFYGFKQLTFSSNFSDSSYLRETVAADLFRAAGVPAAQTAFYAVSVDTGDGPVYFGLYTAVEAVDDTLIQTQFEDDSGNVYKPSGSAATFADGSYNEDQYDKETNKKEKDYSDVKTLLEVLNSGVRLTDAKAWRKELESVLDVDTFLKWLAANTVMQNWDTYGSMSHNYYLYHDPISDQLVWIPWDNNQSLSSGGGGGGGRGGSMGTSSSSIGNESVGGNWPLISYLLADETYQQQYTQEVEQFINNVFNPDSLEPVLTETHDLISPYVEAEQEGYTTLSDINPFDASVESLMEHIRSRYQAALDYLAENS